MPSASPRVHWRSRRREKDRDGFLVSSDCRPGTHGFKRSFHNDVACFFSQNNHTAMKHFRPLKRTGTRVGFSPCVAPERTTKHRWARSLLLLSRHQRKRKRRKCKKSLVRVIQHMDNFNGKWHPLLGTVLSKALELEKKQQYQREHDTLLCRIVAYVNKFMFVVPGDPYVVEEYKL